MEEEGKRGKGASAAAVARATPPPLSSHLGHHLVVRVTQQRDALQSGDRPREQRHVGRDGKGNFERRAEQVLRERLEIKRLGAAARQVRAQHAVHDGYDDATVAVGGEEI